MGDPLMEIGERELEKIGKYVQSHLAEWSGGNIIAYRGTYDTEYLERLIKLEESQKSTIELMRQGFEQMEKRFEQVEKRFEQVEKRFEQVEKRFEQVEKRFELMERQMDKRFDQVDKRFSQLQWTMGLGFTIMAALMGVFNFF